MSQSSRLALLRRIRLLGAVASELNCNAATVAGTALWLWCKQQFKFAPAPKLPTSNELAATPQLRNFVELLREMDLLEASYWLSSAYAMLIDETYRKKLAMFFTPASLTRGLLDDLVAQGVDFSQHSFLDPACGGAAFLVPIAVRMRDELEARGLASRARLKHIERHLFGTDKDATLCKLSCQFLYMALHKDIEDSGYAPTFNIEAADALKSPGGKLGRRDVVVCNPPYRKLSAEEVALLDPAFAQVTEAQPNIYSIFIFHCVRLVRPGGVVALVTPTSFLSGRYFTGLRSFLVRNTDVEHIGMVSERKGVFIDVEQETALTVLRRRMPDDRTAAQAKVSVVSVAGEYTPVGASVLPGGGSVWPIPRAVADVELLKRAATSKFRLADYGYRIRIGAYVWNRDKRPKYDTLWDVVEAKTKTAVPLLWSRDISPGGYLTFDPERKAEGHHFVDLGDKLHPAVVRQCCVVMQRVTSNDQPRRLVVASVPPSIFLVHGGFVGENHIVILEPSVDLPELLPNDLADLLGTHAVDRIYRCISGATNVSSFELSQLALPDPAALKKYRSQGDSMEQAVNRSYGLDISGVAKQAKN
ncbi:HsdM family class I SAM-dependent methyltransferase [Bordetella petrii]|uniref:site-specific DNA-methyltransferase (adenine-specific) n=1 Tax=Bordetella petrii TaxID=94624 RepID=A0ABT7W9D1_9BORD|nr:N-6 DNA methylase [Bordetella petrii]MDM9561786.1 N-6 DNA methylase [Bordetella petrii]